MTEPAVTYGVPVPWYRLNGWIIQSGGVNWARWQFHILGWVVMSSPWLWIGPLEEDEAA